jgi:hypothetical protein
MKKAIPILLLLYSSFVLSQENKVIFFSTEHLELTKIIGINTNDNHKTILKQQIAEVQKQLKALEDLQNTVPKVAFSKQHFFYTKNDFMGMYNVYNSANCEVHLQQSYFNYHDFMPTCAMPGPVSNGDTENLVGALLYSLLSDADIKFKLGKRHTITFF